MMTHDRSHLTHIVLRSRYGRYDVVLSELPLNEFCRMHQVDGYPPRPVAVEDRNESLDDLAAKYFPEHFAKPATPAIAPSGAQDMTGLTSPGVISPSELLRRSGFSKLRRFIGTGRA